MNSPRQLVNELCSRFAGQQDRLSLLVGYVCCWNCPSTDARRDHVAVFVRGCFDESLKSGRAIDALEEHIQTRLLGSTSIGSLRLACDGVGLLAVICPPDTVANRLLHESIRREPRGMSFHYSCHPSGMVETEVSGRRVRLIQRAEIHEVSIVQKPSIPATRVQLVRDASMGDSEIARHQRAFSELGRMDEQHRNMEPAEYIGSSAGLINTITNARARLQLSIL